ncbi:MAG: hypothetical protein JW843_03925 [Candidatus Aminicenantes bacterium]|nr:hypothetical protein [Candidatus Aminicenantes bacterium]
MNILRQAPRIARILAVPVLAFALTACNALENVTDSMSRLIIISMMGQNQEGQPSDYIQSDVLFEDPSTGATSIFADIATAVLTAQMLDPDPVNGISSFADIQLEKYQVRYTRTDGRNTPGLDVPYPIEGDMTSLILVGAQTSVSFVIVRESAKMEPPLLDLLQDSTRAENLTAIATVDFFGHDLSGKAVKATGSISITFANYGN